MVLLGPRLSAGRQGGGGYHGVPAPLVCGSEWQRQCRSIPLEGGRQLHNKGCNKVICKEVLGGGVKLMGLEPQQPLHVPMRILQPPMWSITIEQGVLTNGCTKVPFPTVAWCGTPHCWVTPSGGPSDHGDSHVCATPKLRNTLYPRNHMPKWEGKWQALLF